MGRRGPCDFRCLHARGAEFRKSLACWHRRRCRDMSPTPPRSRGCAGLDGRWRRHSRHRDHPRVGSGGRGARAGCADPAAIRGLHPAHGGCLICRPLPALRSSDVTPQRGSAVWNNARRACSVVWRPGITWIMALGGANRILTAIQACGTGRGRQRPAPTARNPAARRALPELPHPLRPGNRACHDGVLA